ncbi:MAG: amino acid ABC transporter permease [Treponema sp.]|jgi:polar amino acid transport system permease protein/polar amino acid transport system substrate-binding protein|nr:amino acid ABC transporter permease [Treponema sp.]
MINLLYENLVANGAHRYFLFGLGITALITVAGLCMGTIAGAILCAMSGSRFRPLRLFARIYFLLTSGTPVLLLLTLFYYVALAPFGVNALVTAVIVFGLRSGALLGEIMRSALASADRGQIQAARTLGFSAPGAFLHVTLPQALRFAKPLCRHSAIAVLQDTSVVGYIAVSDLTRIVNNMGSRTGNPFLAMATGIVLYLLLSWAISLCFSAKERRRPEDSAEGNESLGTKAA